MEQATHSLPVHRWMHQLRQVVLRKSALTNGQPMPVIEVLDAFRNVHGFSFVDADISASQQKQQLQTKLQQAVRAEVIVLTDGGTGIRAIVTRKTIEQLLHQVSSDLTTAQQHLNMQTVIATIHEWLGFHSLKVFGLPERFLDFPILESLGKQLKLVDLLIDTYTTTRHIQTLFDLEIFLCTELSQPGQQIQSYRQLQFGDLSRHPTVFKMFKYQGGASAVPKITDVDVLVAIKNVIKSHSNEAASTAKLLKRVEQTSQSASKVPAKKQQAHQELTMTQQGIDQNMMNSKGRFWQAEVAKALGRKLGAGHATDLAALGVAIPYILNVVVEMHTASSMNDRNYREALKAVSADGPSGATAAAQAQGGLAGLRGMNALTETDHASGQATKLGFLECDRAVTLPWITEAGESSEPTGRKAPVTLVDESDPRLAQLQQLLGVNKGSGGPISFDMIMMHFAITVKKLLASCGGKPTPAFFKDIGKSIADTYYTGALVLVSKKKKPNKAKRQQTKCGEFWSGDLLAQMTLRLLYIMMEPQLRDQVPADYPPGMQGPAQDMSLVPGPAADKDNTKAGGEDSSDDSDDSDQDNDGTQPDARSTHPSSGPLSRSQKKAARKQSGVPATATTTAVAAPAGGKSSNAPRSLVTPVYLTGPGGKKRTAAEAELDPQLPAMDAMTDKKETKKGGEPKPGDRADAEKGSGQDARTGNADAPGGVASDFPVHMVRSGAAGRIVTVTKAVDQLVKSVQAVRKEDGTTKDVLFWLRQDVMNQLGNHPLKAGAIGEFVDFVLRRQQVNKPGSDAKRPNTTGEAAHTSKDDLQDDENKKKASRKGQGHHPGQVPSPVLVAVSKSQILQHIDNLSHGTSVIDLAQLEADLLATLKVTRFSDLQVTGLSHGKGDGRQYESLLAVAAADADVAAVLAHAAHDDQDHSRTTTSVQDGLIGNDNGAVAHIPCLQDVLLVLSQALCSIGLSASALLQNIMQSRGQPSSHSKAVARCLCQHFGVARVTGLGHGSMKHLLRLLSGDKQSAVASTVPMVFSAAALTLKPLSATYTSSAAVAADAPQQLLNLNDPTAQQQHQQQHVGLEVQGEEMSVLGEVTPAMALAVLSRAPPLVDLHTYTQWQAVFQPSLGRLQDFLQQQGPGGDACGLLLPPGCGPVLSLPHGRCIKLASKPESQDWRQDWTDALLSADSRRVACVAVSMIAAHGGLSAAPISLFAQHTADCLAALLQQASTDTAAPGNNVEAADKAAVDDPGLLQVAAFVLGALACLPLPLLAPLADPLLLQPFHEVCGSPATAHTALLKAALASTTAGNAATRSRPGATVRVSQDPELCCVARSALHHLSFALGVDIWQQDFMSLTQPLPVTRQPANVISAADADADVVTGTAGGKGEPTEASIGDVPATKQEGTQGDSTLTHVPENQPPAAMQMEGTGTATAVDGSQAAAQQQQLHNGTHEAQVPTLTHNDNAANVNLDSNTVSDVAMAQVQALRQQNTTSVQSTAYLQLAVKDGRVAVTLQQDDRGAVPAASHQAAAVNNAMINTLVRHVGPDPARLSLCKAVVDSIRRQFGIGLQLDAVGAEVVSGLNALNGRALEKLSSELYSKDTHFVLELVQNADDNTYPEGVVPTLELVVTSDRITLLNNEVGFTERNIRALCNVGMSTKSKALGYIGQKGIGFKSVFRVSDQPHIHSNGFNVVFDLKAHKSLGYILPTWVDDDVTTPQAASPDGVVDPTTTDGFILARPTHGTCTNNMTDDVMISRALSSVRVDSGKEPATTCIVLPLKAEFANNGGAVGVQRMGRSGAFGLGSRTLLQKFSDVQPQLLLFLQRLRRLVVTRRDEGHAEIMLRRQVTDHVVELRVTRITSAASSNTSNTPQQHAPDITATAGVGAAPVDLSVASPGNSRSNAQAAQGRSTSQHWLVLRSTIIPDLPRLDVDVPETQVCLAWCISTTSTSATAPGSAAGSQDTLVAAQSSIPAPVLQPPVLGTTPSPSTSSLGGDGAGGGVVTRPPQQPVYAFLPLRSYGLRFVVQADWVVPSSREAVDGDNPWNQALRNNLPAAFYQAFRVFKSMASPGDATSAIRWVDFWLSSLPLEGEAQGFFSSLPRSISAKLQATPCIPTAGGEWVTPRQAMVCNFQPISDLLAQAGGFLKQYTSAAPAGLTAVTHGQEKAAPAPEMSTKYALRGGAAWQSDPDLSDLMHLHWVHPDLVTVNGSPALRRLIGILDYNPSRLLLVAKAICRHKLQAAFPPAWISKLLLCIISSGSINSTNTSSVYGAAHEASTTNKAQMISQLRHLPILPLADGTFAAAVPPRSGQHHAPGSGDVMHADQGMNTLSSILSSAQESVFFGPSAAGDDTTLQTVNGMATPSTQQVSGMQVVNEGADVRKRLQAHGMNAGRIMHGFRSLHPDLLDNLSGPDTKHMQTALRTCLEDMGVRHLDMHHVFWLYVLPQLKQLHKLAMKNLNSQDTAMETPGTTAVSTLQTNTATPAEVVALVTFPLVAGLITVPAAAVSSSSVVVSQRKQASATAHGQQDDVLSALKQYAVLTTVDSTIVPAPTSSPAPGMMTSPADTPPPSVYPPPDMGGLLDLNGSFSKYGPWHVLHPEYARLAMPAPAAQRVDVASGNARKMKDSGSDAVQATPSVGIDSLKWLLSQLGVQALPAPQPRLVALRSLRDLKESCWAGEPWIKARMKQLIEAVPGTMTRSEMKAARLVGPGLQILDMHSPDLDRLINALVEDSSNSTSVGRAHAAQTKLQDLATVMAAHWDTVFSPVCAAYVLGSEDCDCINMDDSTQTSSHAALHGLYQKLKTSQQKQGANSDEKLPASDQNPVDRLDPVMCEDGGNQGQQQHTKEGRSYDNTSGDAVADLAAPMTTMMTFSSTAHLLRNTAWLAMMPSQGDLDKKKKGSSSDMNVFKPSELFMPVPEVTKILGQHVPYLSIPTPSSLFVSDLGIRTSVDVGTVLTLIQSWSTSNMVPTVTKTAVRAKGSGDGMADAQHLLKIPTHLFDNAARSVDSGGAYYYSVGGEIDIRAHSAQYMAQLYKVLQEAAVKDEQVQQQICNAFQEGCLIWVPYWDADGMKAASGPAKLKALPLVKCHNQVLYGRWCGLQDVVWEDPSNVMEAAIHLMAATGKLFDEHFPPLPSHMLQKQQQPQEDDPDMQKGSDTTAKRRRRKENKRRRRLQAFKPVDMPRVLSNVYSDDDTLHSFFLHTLSQQAIVTAAAAGTGRLEGVDMPASNAEELQGQSHEQDNNNSNALDDGLDEEVVGVGVPHTVLHRPRFSQYLLAWRCLALTNSSSSMQGTANKLVFRLMAFLHDQVSCSAINAAQFNSMQAFVRNNLVLPVRPVNDQSWACLHDHTLLVDDEKLADLIWEAQDSQRPDPRSGHNIMLFSSGVLTTQHVLSMVQTVCSDQQRRNKRTPRPDSIVGRSDQVETTSPITHAEAQKIVDFVLSLGMKPLSAAVSPIQHNQYLWMPSHVDKTARQEIDMSGSSSSSSSSSDDDDTDSAGNVVLTEVQVKMKARLNRLIQKVLPSAQAFILSQAADAQDKDKSLNSTLHGIITYHVNNVKIELVKNLEQSWVLKKPQDAANHDAAIARAGITTATTTTTTGDDHPQGKAPQLGKVVAQGRQEAAAAGNASSPNTPLLTPYTAVAEEKDVTQVVVPRHKVHAALSRSGSLYMDVQEAGDFLQLAWQLSRVFTGGGPSLPALSDVLYTCLLAAAAGQDLDSVLRLRGVPPLPPGVMPWQSPAVTKVTEACDKYLVDLDEARKAAVKAKAEAKARKAAAAAKAKADAEARAKAAAARKKQGGAGEAPATSDSSSTDDSSSSGSSGSSDGDTSSSEDSGSVSSSSSETSSEVVEGVEKSKQIEVITLDDSDDGVVNKNTVDENRNKKKRKRDEKGEGSGNFPGAELSTFSEAGSDDGQDHERKRQRQEEGQADVHAGGTVVAADGPSSSGFVGASALLSASAAGLIKPNAHTYMNPNPQAMRGVPGPRPPPGDPPPAAAGQAPDEPYIHGPLSGMYGQGMGTADNTTNNSKVDGTDGVDYDFIPIPSLGRSSARAPVSLKSAPASSAPPRLPPPPPLAGAFPPPRPPPGAPPGQGQGQGGGGGGGGSGGEIKPWQRNLSAAAANVNQQTYVPSQDLMAKHSMAAAMYRRRPDHDHGATIHRHRGSGSNSSSVAPQMSPQQITGRWGEELAWHYLQDHKQQADARGFPGHDLLVKPGDTVEWVNQASETGKPYDLVITELSGQQRFIEVKTTRHVEKDFFEMSVSEWQWAQQHGRNYQILRVSGALGNSPQIVALTDPVAMWRAKAIAVCLFI